jgi:hypothetical protein
MEYAEAIDIGAPEIFVSGISRIERIGAGTVRVTYFSQHADGNRVCLYAIWDLKTWVTLWRNAVDWNAIDLMSEGQTVEFPAMREIN